MTLRFHATAPGGQWLNDPNALYYRDGAFTLLAQHRADGPEFRSTGWARLTSPDLLRWRFADVAIPPEGERWSYSGSLAPVESLEAIHTLHAAGLESQVWRTSADGKSWSAAVPLASLGPPQRNRRDPFIFRFEDEWRLLLSEPCDWHEWRDEGASRLRLFGSQDRIEWSELGTIGPFHPPGVMWEVPLLVPISGHWVLFISCIDRRGDGAPCSVRGWVGSFDGTEFQTDRATDPDGQLIDLGPDFYALMQSSDAGWPLPEPAFVAWLSSWQTARAMAWPGFAGGPISLPRSLRVESVEGEPRIMSYPLPGLAEQFTRPGGHSSATGLAALDAGSGVIELDFRSGDGRARIVLDCAGGRMTVEREAPPPLRYETQAERAFPPGADARLQLFVDRNIIELFELGAGWSASIALPDDENAMRVDARIDGQPIALRWRTLDRD